MNEAKGPGTSEHCLVPLCVLSAVFRHASSGFFSKSAGFAFGTNLLFSFLSYEHAIFTRHIYPKLGRYTEIGLSRVEI